MQRVVAMAATLLFGCAGVAYPPRGELTAPLPVERAASSPRGGAYGPNAGALIPLDADRSCQIVVSSRFAHPYSVFLTDEAGAMARASVAVASPGSKATVRTAPLDRRLAHRIARLCRTMIGRADARNHIVTDGVRYHVSALTPGHAYAYGVAHSPPFGSHASELVTLFERLRDYVLLYEDALAATRLEGIVTEVEHLEGELDLAPIRRGDVNSE